MDRYSKGRNVEPAGPLTKESVPAPPGTPTDFVWMRVSAGAKMRNLAGYASKAVEEEDVGAVVFSGRCRAIGKVISCAEIVKRRYPGELHQYNNLCTRVVEEHWEPKKKADNSGEDDDVEEKAADELDGLKVVREIPEMHITLCKTPCQAGRQPPSLAEFLDCGVGLVAAGQQPASGVAGKRNDNRQQQQRRKRPAGSRRAAEELGMTDRRGGGGGGGRGGGHGHHRGGGGHGARANGGGGGAAAGATAAKE